jgi:hypothetical protein
MNEASSRDLKALFHGHVNILSTLQDRKGTNAMTIFLLLSGIGGVFMLYVLVNFWREGRRITHNMMRPYRVPSHYGNCHEVIVTTRLVDFEAEQLGKTSLIHFPVSQSRTKLGGTEAGQAPHKKSPRKYSSG